MSPAAIIVIAFIAIVSILAVVATIVVLVTHLKHLNGTMTDVRETVQPELARLREASDVARRELERVSDAASEIRPDAG